VGLSRKSLHMCCAFRAIYFVRVFVHCIVFVVCRVSVRVGIYVVCVSVYTSPAS